MRVAVATRQFPVLSETFVLDHVTGLLEVGCDVEILALRRGAAGPRHGELERDRLAERTRIRARIPGGRTRRWRRALAGLAALGLRRPAGARQLLPGLPAALAGSDWEALYAALAFLAGPEPDLVHCHFGSVGELFARLKRRGWLRAPLLASFHGEDLRAGLSQGPGLYRELAARADRVIAGSGYARQQLLALGFAESRLALLPVGIDCARFETAGDSRRREPGAPLRILSVARLVPEKGLGFGLEAVRRCLDAQPDGALSYRIVGAGPLEAELRAHARALGLSEVVHFAGGLAREKVLRALAEADLYLLPGIDEALGVNLMEAQAAGLPVVATRVGGIPEVVVDGDGGFLVPARDPAALADRLLALIRDPALRARQGAAGRRHVRERYDAAPLRDRLLALYRSVLAERGS